MIVLITVYFSTALPSWQVRFYLFRLEDASGALTVQSRTLRSGANDNVLWLNELSQGYSWQKAEATFSSSEKSKVREDQDFRIYQRVNCACLARVNKQLVSTAATTAGQVIFVTYNICKAILQSLCRTYLQTKVLGVRRKDMLQHYCFYSDCLQVWKRSWTQRASCVGRHLFLKRVRIWP